MLEKLYTGIPQFFAKQKLLSFKKHTVVLRPGKNSTEVFFVKRGYLRAYTLSKDGQEFTPIIFQPFDVFPLFWAINDIDNSYYVETLTEVELLCCSKEMFLSFIKENPDDLYFLISRILVRLHGMFQRSEVLAFAGAPEKVASILWICTERFGVRRGNSILINVPLTHRDIASLVGMTRETISIEMKKLQDEKIILYKGKSRIIVLKPKALNQRMS